MKINKKKFNKRKISSHWRTQFEKSNYLESPNYSDTIKYFKKFEAETPNAKLLTIGTSPQKREIKLLVVSKGNEFTPEEAAKSSKAVVLIQNGIHPGEIEGKDACMLLLREILITKEKEDLLDNIILLIIPVFNVDGHERLSYYNRPNQNGPKEMGWRTTSQNLNLNRDYMKADTPEMRSWLKMFSAWLPDFMIDNHTTNGADYQYHVTYGIEKFQNIHPLLSNLVRKKYLPYLLSQVEREGFLTAPYIEFKGGSIESGIIDYPLMPRLSTGYCAVQNRICLLVETHSLKPFKNRVFSTKSMMVHSLEFINENFKELKRLNKKADEDSVKEFFNNKKEIPVQFIPTEKFDTMKFKGFKSYQEESHITGTLITRFTNSKTEFDIPIFNKSIIGASIKLPLAYSIPEQFTNIIEILNCHRIAYFQLEDEAKVQIEKYRFTKAEFWKRPYEGRQLVDVEYETTTEEVVLPNRTFIVPTNQRTIRVIANLFEPKSPDSFVSWGFFNAFFERKEYAEDFVMEPYAKKMLEENVKLRNEFFQLLKVDENFKLNSHERLDFFYRHSPFFDNGEMIYPIYRIINY